MKDKIVKTRVADPGILVLIRFLKELGSGYTKIQIALSICIGQSYNNLIITIFYSFNYFDHLIKIISGWILFSLIRTSFFEDRICLFLTFRSGSRSVFLKLGSSILRVVSGSQLPVKVKLFRLWSTIFLNKFCRQSRCLRLNLDPDTYPVKLKQAP